MNDKLLHLGACFVATVVACLCTIFLGKVSAIICGALFALGLGLGKEYGDSKASGNKWDWLDILADVVGILLGVWVMSIFLK